MYTDACMYIYIYTCTFSFLHPGFKELPYCDFVNIYQEVQQVEQFMSEAGVKLQEISASWRRCWGRSRGSRVASMTCSEVLGTS